MNPLSYNEEHEKKFFKTLKNLAYIFPETNEELENFEECISKTKFKIPDKFNDALAVLRNGRIDKIGDFNSFLDPAIEENLAHAAREGSNIPSDVWEQMEKDRINAEKSNNGEKTE